MIEDLHEIDNLFRDGLQGHVEQAPVSVWKGVSNELDKKQAVYYKQKYIHLQKMVFALAIVCLITATFIYVHLSSDHRTSAKENATPLLRASNQNPNTPRTQVNALKKFTPELKTNQPNQEQDVPAVASTHESKEMNSSERNVGERPRKLSAYFQYGVPSTSNTLTQPINIEASSIQLYPFALTTHGAPQMIPITAASIDEDALLQQQRAVVKLKSTTPHAFYLSVFVAPNFSFDRLEEDHPMGGPGGPRHNIHDNEEQQYSYSAGLAVEYAWNRKFSLQSGISYTASSKSIPGAIVYAEPDNNGHVQYRLHCASGNVNLSTKGVQPSVGDSTRTLGTTTNLSYISIPAFLSYRMNAGRFFLQPRAGFGLNILLSGNAETTLANAGGAESNKTNISGLSQTYVDAQIGMGFGYDLNQKFAIAIMPNFRLGITPMNSATPVKSYQNFLSVELGVKIKL